jgi:hypothetical protein
MDLSWIPRKQIPDALKVYDYTITRPDMPLGTKFGEASMGVSVGRLESNRPVMSYRSHVNFNKTEMAIAQRNGYAMVTEAIREVVGQTQLMIAQLFFQGSTPDRDRVNIGGAFDYGEDCDASLDTTYWATATSPVTHVAAGALDLINNYYAPPFTFVASWNLMPGMVALNNAANPRTHEEICRAQGYIDRVVYGHAPAASATHAYGTGGMRIYPLPPPTTDDGCWAMFKVSPENFYIAQVTNGIEVSEMQFDPATNYYTTYVEWRGTPVFRGADASAEATYIVYEPDVDLAS